jgi:hypothetical protein
VNQNTIANVCEHGSLRRKCDVCLLQSDLAEAHREIRRLRMALALATSKVTPWYMIERDSGKAVSGPCGGWLAAYSHRKDRERNLRKFGYVFRLGDGTPEQETP